MTYEVQKMFCDKRTGDVKLAGSFCEFDTKRANELIKLGFLKGEEKQTKKSGE